MIAIPIEKGKGTYDVVIIFNDQSLDRIKSYDPACLEVDKLPEPFKTELKLKQIHLMYANAEEIKELTSLPKSFPELGKFLNKLSRGFTYRPDLGDHDSDEGYQEPLSN